MTNNAYRLSGYTFTIMDDENFISDKKFSFGRRHRKRTEYERLRVLGNECKNSKIIVIILKSIGK